MTLPPTPVPPDSGGTREASESEIRFRALFEQAPFSVQLLAPDERTRRVNRAWDALWQTADGDGLKEYVLTQYNMLSDPQLKAKGITPYLERAFAGESVNIPAILYDPAEIGKPGNVRWVMGQAHPIMNGAGQVMEVMLIHEDITERLDREQALRDSEQRLQAGLEAGPMMVWDWDIRNDQVVLSSNAAAIFGVSWDTASSGWSMVHPEDAARLREATNRSVRERSEYHELVRMIRADNSDILWVDVRGRVVCDDQGEPVMIRGIALDVTTQVNAVEQLEQADRKKDEFLAMLAHELRNPLAPISTAAELLQMHGLNERQIRHASDVILRQVQHMTVLVNDLLDVSRVTRGLVQLAMADLDLKSVVDSAMEQVRPLIEARAHVVTTTLSPQPAHAVGDRARLIQVLVNLLNNAAKYRPHAGRIDLTLAVNERTISITLADNGIGIDAALLPHVFDLFTQASRTPDRSQGGLGIGLALVRSIMLLHGGEVEVSSKGIGLGSTFRISFPVSAGEQVVAGPARDQAGRL